MSVHLSNREASIVACVAEGKTIKEIGQELRITYETTKTHLRDIRRKYRNAGRDAGTMVRLTRCAIEDGLIPPILPREILPPYDPLEGNPYDLVEGEDY